MRINANQPCAVRNIVLSCTLSLIDAKACLTGVVERHAYSQGCERVGILITDLRQGHRGPEGPDTAALRSWRWTRQRGVSSGIWVWV